MEYIIHVGTNPIKFIHDNIESSINVDDLTKIDYSNLFGEHVTMSAATNRIGLIKAEAQARMAEVKIELKMFEGNFKSKLRKQAAENSGYFTLRIDNEDVKIKLTERALDTSFETDKEWVKLKNEFIQAEKNFVQLEVLYWSCQDKCRKLNGLVSGTTPDEYVKEMIEGKINGILIQKK